MRRKSELSVRKAEGISRARTEGMDRSCTLFSTTYKTRNRQQLTGQTWQYLEW